MLSRFACLLIFLRLDSGPAKKKFRVPSRAAPIARVEFRWFVHPRSLLPRLSAPFAFNCLSRRAVRRSRRDTRLLDDELHPLLQEAALRLRQRRGKRQLAAGRIKFLSIDNRFGLQRS